ADEFLLMGLRLAEGIDLSRYQALARRTLDADRIAAVSQQGLVDQWGDGRLRITRTGIPVLNTIIAQLATYCLLHMVSSRAGRERAVRRRNHLTSRLGHTQHRKAPLVRSIWATAEDPVGAREA